MKQLTLATGTQPRTRSKIKLPCDAFKQCPYCDSQNLKQHGIHVFCHYCEWNSVTIYAELKADMEDSKAIGHSV